MDDVRFLLRLISSFLQLFGSCHATRAVPYRDRVLWQLASESSSPFSQLETNAMARVSERVNEKAVHTVATSSQWPDALVSYPPTPIGIDSRPSPTASLSLALGVVVSSTRRQTMEDQTSGSACAPPSFPP